MRFLSKYTKHEGSDACLAISLFEYGMIWRVNRLSTKFTYIIKHSDAEKRSCICDSSILNNDVNVNDIYDWVDWGAFYSSIGLTEVEWMESNLTQKIFDLYTNFGHEEIFGSSYYGGFIIKEGN